ncbi:hypothetical protein [Halotia branconii]|uniref:Uncharacterized protein n=1 Tax=Halotia branconii CENA392 TaxID=1539056 RepID=A0AAJ6NSP0_9CYAN|nr:hypothetical protein [Halotia branconii]WGV25823.1 hypothetical protein QI031_29595 [Halotia branconii CENA392]
MVLLEPKAIAGRRDAEGEKTAKLMVDIQQANLRSALADIFLRSQF